MTDQELVDTVKDMVTNTKIQTRILGWANAFVAYLSREYQFEHLKVYAASQAITSGDNQYTLAGVGYLTNVWIPEYRIPSVEERYGGEQELTERMPGWNTESGPIHCYLFAGGVLTVIMV